MSRLRTVAPEPTLRCAQDGAPGTRLTKLFGVRAAMTKEFSKEDWLVTIVVFVLVISSDVLAGRLGYGQKLSDECAITIGVFGLIIGFWRGGAGIEASFGFC